MVRAVARRRGSERRFDEKQFYLDEFRGRTLCLAVQAAEAVRAGAVRRLGPLLVDLLANDTRVILFIEQEDGPSREARSRWLRRLSSRLLRGEVAARFPLRGGRRSLADSFVELAGDGSAEETLRRVWDTLRHQPLLVGLVHDSLLDFVPPLAARLRVHKLVLVETGGGVCTPGGSNLSFMDGAVLDTTLQAGQAEWAGVAARRRTLQAVQLALRGGVGSVNLCSLDGLAHELFTYEGSGTLFTLADYCRVERLGIDDFEEVERLIERGQREGYLKPRSSAEISGLLVNGYGARIASGHLAGMCVLFPYRVERAAEVAALYTITRFQGEGVAARLLRRVMVDAEMMGMRYVFACTTETHAARFFTRHGFRSVEATQIPAGKWRGYDRRRRARVTVLRREINCEAAGDRA